MQITSIVPQKRYKDRVNIFVDNQFALATTIDFLVKNKLTVGDQISPDRLKTLASQGQFSLWYQKCLNLLSYRPRSSQEISDYLTKHKRDKLEISQIKDKLRQQNLLNDYQFAAWFVEQRCKFHPKGKLVLQQELRQKGISRKIIDLVLAEKLTNQKELARKLVAKKLPKMSSVNRQKRKSRLIAYLSRRGFDWELIETVLQELKLD